MRLSLITLVLPLVWAAPQDLNRGGQNGELGDAFYGAKKSENDSALQGQNLGSPSVETPATTEQPPSPPPTTEDGNGGTCEDDEEDGNTVATDENVGSDFGPDKGGARKTRGAKWDSPGDSVDTFNPYTMNPQSDSPKDSVDTFDPYTMNPQPGMKPQPDMNPQPDLTKDLSNTPNSTPIGGNPEGKNGTDNDEDLGNPTDIKSIALRVHNEYRSNHPGTPPLKWSEDLANSADTTCQSCQMSHDRTGQNLYSESGYGGGADAVERAIRDWYSEGSTGSQVNHYTQVVWKSTTSVGCAVKTDCKINLSTMVVCNYDPPGNVLGQVAENVG